MEDAVIVAVSGEVWIRDTAGNMRMARVGDRIEEGSVLVTGPTGLARLDFGESEEPLVVGADHQLSVPFGQGDGDSPPSGEVLPEERLDLLLKVLEPGASERSDLQPLAGSAAVDGEANEGYGFVRLLRILEKVSPLDFPFDVSPIDEVQPRSGSVDPRDGGLAPDERIDDDFSRSGSDENQAALAPTVLLDEDGLPRGTAGGPGDAPGTDVVAGGVLGYDEGMREAAVDGALHWLTDGLPVITSQGQALVWSVSDGGLTLSGVDAYGAPLLSVTVTDPLKGEYEARLYQRLDHPDRSTEDDIVLTLGYEVTSRDGDAAQGSLVLIVDDDMPTLIIEGPRGAEEDGSLRGTWVQDGGGDEQSEILVTLSGGDTRYSLDTPIDTGGGLLLVESDNSWTFVPDASAEDGGTPPGFDITITDGDGDTATAQLCADGLRR